MQTQYWFGTSIVGTVEGNAADMPHYGDRAKFFEPNLANRNVGIKIRNMTKVSIIIHYFHRLKFGNALCIS